MAQSPDVLGAELPGRRGRAAQAAADVGHVPEHFPCSLGQRRFWILDQLNPGDPSLNVAVRWRLEGSVSAAQLERAFQQIIARHSVLRTSLAAVGGEPIQVVAPRISFRIPVIELSQLPEAEAEAEALRIARTEAQASFDLSVPPLIRVTLVRVREHLSFLLVTAHHTICDGWSIGILARELIELCAAEHAGTAAQLPELPVSYGDFAAWQADWIQNGDFRDDEDFWVRLLRGSRQVEVHPDHPRPPTRSTAGEIESTLLDRAVTDRLQELSRRHGCTLFMVSLAALLALLQRYTGAEDISVGTQVAGRDDTDLEDLVGMFINTLVLRADVSGNPTFAQLCRRVRGVVTEAFDHQQMPLERLIELLKPPRDPSRHPLFSINFIFQRSFIRNGSGGSFDLIDVPSVPAGAMYDLNFFMVERPEGWRASCEFNSGLFQRATITRLLGHFASILTAVGHNEHQLISSLPLLSPAERRELLFDRNDTAAEYPRHLSVTDLFAAQAARSPQSIAVVCGDSQLRYRELDAASSRLANTLRRRGITPGSRVGIFVDRSIELPVALLAVLKAGCSYIPLDPIYPRDRLRHIIEDSGTSILISKATHRERLPESRVPLLLLDTEAASIEANSSELPAPPASSSELAYVIYTSGSTGTPKGVQIPQIALTNFLCSMQREPGLTDQDSLLAVTTISFDIAALEMFLPLVTGATLVIAREHEVGDGRELISLLNRHRVTVMQATPVTWQLLLDSGWTGERRLKMLCGGEALPRTLAQSLLDCGGELWNMYGPTETTIWSAALQVSRGEQAVPVGGPIANTQFYVVDSMQNLVPRGVPGELVIGGDGVARGYWNLAKQTAEKFLPDTFRNVAGATVYRTGDLVRALPNGTLEFLGRADHQIKLRGYRIELGEIETALLGHPDIADAVVHAGKTPSGEVAIWAYVVAKHVRTGTHQLIASLEQRLQKTLPAYMLPASITVLPSLPRTPNGKVDRKALPEPARLQPIVGAPPANDLERRLAAIWCTVLDIQSVDRIANFFEIGGHSVLAARVAARIEAEFGRPLSLAALFGAPTLEQQARLLDDRVFADRQLDFRPVVKLQPNGTRPPLIAINNTGNFYSLSKRLGVDQPFTCLQLFDPGSTAQQLPDSVEELAAEYVRLIRRVEPQGPYALIGWCVAGALTFEVARQLTESGQTVSMLALVDTWVPGHLRRLGFVRGKLTDYNYRWCLVRQDFRRVLEGRQSLGGFLRQRNLFKGLKKLFGRKAPEPRNTAEALGPRTAEDHDQWLLRYLEAKVSRYEPRLYPGKVILFRSEQEPHGPFIDERMGWGPFTSGGVDVVKVQGDHFTAFNDPGVGVMAATISGALAGNSVDR